VQVSALDQGPVEPGPSTQSSARSPDGRQGLVLVLEGGDAQAAAGSEHVARVRVRNTGSIVERVDFRIDGAPEEWAEFEPSQVNIDQGDEQVALLRFRPPREATTPAGPALYQVLAWSLTNPTVRVAELGRLVVLPFAAGRVSIDALVAESRRGGDYAVTVANSGNVALQAAVEPVDATNRLRLHASRRDVALAPGEATTVTLEARARKRIWTGSPVTHPFSVVLRPLGGPPISDDAVLTQKPVLPRWAPRAAAIAVVVVALGAAVPVRNWWQGRPRAVPAAVGKGLDDARAALLEAGFKAETRQTPSPQPAGQVVGQEPGAGRDAAGGATVVLTVSQGPAPVKVPDVAKLTIAAARQKLEAAGLRVGETPRDDEETAAGTVLDQRPRPGETVPPGFVVELTVSAGAQQVAVPPLVGLSRDEALAELRARGLIGRPKPRAVEGLDPDTVIEQDPKEGTKVDKDHTVIITVTPTTVPTVPAPAPGPTAAPAPPAT
jgi:beta-lactam-binding protein with PASTA domain